MLSNDSMVFSPIETERLLLRAWRNSDLLPFAHMNADARVREFFPSFLTREESDASVNRFTEKLAEDGFTFWAVEEKASGAFAGFTGLLKADFPAHFTPCVEIGWRFAVPFWGRGLASEAAQASLTYGFHTLELPEIVAFAAESNMPSRRVMERIGMTYDTADNFIHPKIPPDHSLQPCVLYRVTAERWKTRARRNGAQS